MPIIISEPAVDGGLGLAGVFFHRRPESETRESDVYERPSLSAIAGAYTGNESWFAGAGHLGIWREDTLHYRGGVGYTSVNLEYYGTELLPIDQGLDFNTEGVLVMQELLARIGDSRWMVGGRWLFTKLDITFDTGGPVPGVDPLERDFQDSGAGLVVEYERLDSTFTPSVGNFLRLQALWHDENLGGDFDYGEYLGRYLHYFQFGKVVLGTRLEARDIEGRAPFIMAPYISLRGIPTLRYQGSTVVTGEVETRWDFHPRFSAVGFVGAGRAAEGFDDLGSSPNRVAGGVGFRYLMARLMGLRLGVDVARGPEDWAFYLTIGSAWPTSR